MKLTGTTQLTSPEPTRERSAPSPIRRISMKKTFAVALLVSASLLACGGKKENTTPVNKDTSMEQKTDATGGAAYGGKQPDGAATQPKPDAPK